MKKEIILAIETSCDETAMCIIDTDYHIYAEVVSSEAETFKDLGGVVPEMASRAHLTNIFYVFEAVLNQANMQIEDIDKIAVTYGPGLVGSLLVGINFANSLALLYNKEIIKVNHMQGHIYATLRDNTLTYPHLSLVISGGHTDLVYLEDELSFKLIGQTLDDAVGEAYDKVSRLLNLGYPGGPVIEKLAATGTPRYDLPLPLNDDSLNFSFSGLKSAVYNLVNQAKMKGEEIDAADLAASFEQSVAKTLANKFSRAKASYPYRSCSVVGGVSANKNICAKLKEIDPDLITLPLELCTDNAQMIGLCAVKQLEKNYPGQNQVIVSPGIDVEQG